MRNLKRTLSLALSATMLSSMMVAGAGAASYADVSSNHHQEAIAVMQAVGVMVGDQNGNFNPDKQVTRAEMAVVMSNLLGLKVEDFKNASIPFTDVPEWARPYVAACYAAGVTSGTSATTYGSNDPVTAVQASLMMMKALGYFQYSSDFGSDWQIATIKQASSIDLFKDINTGANDALSRNNVAQLALNTLEATMVQPTKNGSTIIVGDITITGDVEYKDITSSADYAKAMADKVLDDGKYAVQLGEKLFDGSLKIDTAVTSDAFARPARTWNYKGEQVVVAADEADYVLSGEVTGKELFNTVGETLADSNKYTWTINLDGTTGSTFSQSNVSKSNDNALLGTGNGTVMEIFVTKEYVSSSEKGSVVVSIVNTYAGQISSVMGQDDVDEDEEPYVIVSDLSQTPVADGKKFEATGYDVDDVVLFTYSKKTAEIESMTAARKVSGEVTKVTANESFVVDGQTYKYSAQFKTSDYITTGSVDKDVVFYLDAQGYVIAIGEAESSSDYAFVVGYQDDTKFGTTTHYAKLLLTDGKVIEVETESSASSLDKHIVAYTKDSDNVYTLADKSSAAASSDNNLNIETGKAAMTINGATVYANSQTIFQVKDGDDYVIYTGIQNVPNISDDNSTTKTVVFKSSSNMAKVVYIESAVLESNTAEQVTFVVGDASAAENKDNRGEYYTFDAVVDGKVTTLDVKKSSAAASTLKAEGIFSVKSYSMDANGLVTKVNLYTSEIASVNDGTKRVENGVVGFGNENQGFSYYSFQDNALVVKYDGKDLTVGTINGIKTDANDLATVILKDGAVKAVFIQEVSGNVAPANYKVTYSAGSGSGAPQEATAVQGKDFTISGTEPTYGSHQFLGWSDGEGNLYAAGDVIANVQGNITLTAVYLSDTVTVDDATSSSGLAAAGVKLTIDPAGLDISSKISSVKATGTGSNAESAVGTDTEATVSYSDPNLELTFAKSETLASCTSGDSMEITVTVTFEDGGSKEFTVTYDWS